MLRTMCFAAVVAAAFALTPAPAQAWGVRHVGYTHVGPSGVYHAGRTETAGPGGYHYGGSAYHAGYGGSAGYHYGAGYHTGYGGYSGYAGGYRSPYGGAYGAGVYRRY